MELNVFASVSDKSGLVEALQNLKSSYSLKIVSSGGTAKHLRDSGLEVSDVESLTGFAEVFGGRVKTLHPKVHMGLLYRDKDDIRTLVQEGAIPFQVVLVNLYPFKETVARTDDESERIENIDIGGVALIRAAAKNFKNVAVFCDPKDYQLISEAANSLALRKKLAHKAFRLTSELDGQIAQALEAGDDHREEISWNFRHHKSLRYGENPNQKADWWVGEGSGWQDAEILQGKEMSFNNFLDAEAAVRALRSFELPCCVAVKHNNPCGVAQAETLEVAVEKCVAADPVSIFGGIVALNRELSGASAERLSQIFLEVVIAPSFSPESLMILSKKKNLRLLKCDAVLTDASIDRDVRWISGGVLIQDSMKFRENIDDWKVHGEKLSASEVADSLFSIKTVSELKSNAIAIVKDGQTLGLGMGQVNRVDAVLQALERAKKFHSDKVGWVLASDAFFPFPDSIDLMEKYPVTLVIQPGGSIKDEEVLVAANKSGLKMVLTGQRYFRH